MQAQGNAFDKGIEIIGDFKELPEVVGDSLRLRQVVTNLMSNAVKFTSEGSVTLTCRPVGDYRFSFSVTDTGTGIPEERHEAVFSSFSQASADIASHYGGTGLGLSIAARIVRLLGGEIQLESEVGKGSCFSFEAEFKKDL